VTASLRNAITASAACVAAAWRAMTPKHLVYTSVFGFIWSLFVIVMASSFLTRFQLQPSVNAILSMQFNGFAVLFAVLIADQVSPPARRRYWPYVVAVAVGVLVGTLLVALLTQRVLGLAVGTAYRASGPDEQFRAFFFRHATHAFVIFGLATCVYVSHRWAAHRVRVLRGVQLDHAEMEKRLLESHLAAMQAQVEPGFLRQTLEGVARMYETDARTADLMLRDLIIYLRAAIPRVRQPVSTVAQEIELAEAYLSTLGCASGTRLMRRENQNRIVDNARMPSMILLPLLNRARARHVDDTGESLVIDAAVHDDRLFLTICDRRDGFANDGANDVELTRIRERLAALYGNRARLALRATAGRSEAVLEIPYETASDAMAWSDHVRNAAARPDDAAALRCDR
jgi:hypothetical protein